jgi:hypothetical protein
VISDLHIGAGKGNDLLRRPEMREPLVAAVRGVDRLVVVGDGLELRDGPHRDAVEVAGPFFEDMGRALGADGELLLAAGNHDHGLVAGWIDGRLLVEPSGFLGLEQRIAPSDAGPLAGALAERAAPARVEVVYPGVWLRDDVYAIHGHYSDLHATVPTFERLAAGAMARWAVALPGEGATPDDYEAVLSPLYAWMHALTQRNENALVSAGAGASSRVWVELGGSGRRLRARTVVLRGGLAAAVAVINRLGIGPVERELSGAALRRGYLHGIVEFLHRLGVRAPHVICGHSHRSGPWPGDELSEWTTRAGGRLHNTGSWMYQPHFLGDAPAQSPYFPGTAVLIEDAEPPRLLRLLEALE